MKKPRCSYKLRGARCIKETGHLKASSGMPPTPHVVKDSDMKKPPQPRGRKGKLPLPKVSSLEAEFDLMCRFLPPAFPLIVREYQFDAKRKWRFDRCIPTRLVAIELEGGTWSGGRHTRGDGFEKDCEKYNEAAFQGWRVGRFTARMIESGAALEWLTKTLRGF